MRSSEADRRARRRSRTCRSSRVSNDAGSPPFAVWSTEHAVACVTTEEDIRNCSGRRQPSGADRQRGVQSARRGPLQREVHLVIVLEQQPKPIMLAARAGGRSPRGRGAPRRPVGLIAEDPSTPFCTRRSAEDRPASSASSAVACSRSPSTDFCRRGNFSTVETSHSTKRYVDSTAGPVRRAPDALSVDDALTAAAWYWLVRRGDPGGRGAGYAAGQRARPEAGRLRREPVAVRIQRGRFTLASRMRIPSTSASNSGASSATMAAVRMAS